MGSFILRRMVSSIPVLMGILAVTFFLSRAIPGNPCTAIYGERATPALCAAFAVRNGLDRSVPEQFIIYMGRMLTGDLGTSIRFSTPVTALMAERLPVTIELAFTALLFAILLGVPLGIISAYYRNSAIDVGTMIGANIGVSMPVFWLGLMLAYIFGVVLRGTPFALPPSGRLPAGFHAIPFYEAWGWVLEGQTPSQLFTFISRLNILNAILTLNGDLLLNALRLSLIHI